MEEGRPSGAAPAQFTVQELLWKAPGEAARWMEAKGCAKLGSFKVQARPHSQHAFRGIAVEGAEQGHALAGGPEQLGT